MTPPAPEQFYQLEEFQNGFTKFIDILDKINIELKMGYILNLANYLEKLYENIVAQKDVARKTLKFMDGISKVSQKERTENCL